MANVLNTDKQIAAIAALAEGSSIRSIERIIGVHRDTVMRLGVRVGTACAKIQDEKMRGLNCAQIEVDEIWGSVHRHSLAVNCSTGKALPEKALPSHTLSASISLRSCRFR